MNRQLKDRLKTVLTANNIASRLGTRTPPENEGTGADGEINVEDYYGFDPVAEQKKLSKKNKEGSNFDAGNFETQNTRILGMPHQFLETADFRIDSSNHFGYCFAKEIFMEKPMVTLIPGKPNYLPDYSEADKTVFGNLISDESTFNGNDKAKGLLEKLIEGNEETRYYDFISDFSTYINYVNLMCRVAAIFLELGEELGPDNKTKYKSYNWGNYQLFTSYEMKKSIFNGDTLFEVASDAYEQLKNDLFYGDRTFVNFIIDPSSSVSENISNSTQKSQLEGTFDSMEGIVKEASMFMSSMSEEAGGFQSYITKAGEKILELGNTITGGFFKKMLGLAEEQILHGSNLIYPEIWMDSEYSKTYSLKINLVSPYGSKEAIYLNIIVPIIHALCLALPKQTSANSFTSPFLIRGYSTGWFSIDMGMVESIDIDKGPEQSWTVEGLPTRATVTLTIKDFYAQLMMTRSDQFRLFWTNQGLIDFLGNMCGLDLTKPNSIVKIDVVQMLLANKVSDIIPNNYYKLTEGFKNKVRNFFVDTTLSGI